MRYPKNGRFGEFGGKYIPETLVPAIEELEENYLKIKNDKNFKKELDYYLREYAGRPTPNMHKYVRSSNTPTQPTGMMPNPYGGFYSGTSNPNNPGNPGNPSFYG